MLISLSASGSPAKIHADLRTQAKAACRGDAGPQWPVVATALDYIAAQFAGKPEDYQASVAVTLSVGITEAPPIAASVKAAAEKKPADDTK